MAVDVVVAVDGGNSKTDLAVIGLDGSLLASVRGGGFRPQEVGPEQAVAALAPLVAQALAAAGAGDVRHVSACLANADLPVEHETLAALLTARGWAPSSAVFNDTDALLRAGLGAGPGRWRGVAVVCGAGINAAGVLPEGAEARFAAIGTISGDWGGGGHLWQEAMWWAARAEDGRGPDTDLRLELPQHYDLGSMAELIEAVHLGRVPGRRCLEMTPLLFAVAEAGDAVAADVVRRQAEEVVVMVSAVVRRLGVLEEPIDVVLGGGVLAAGHRLLLDEIGKGLAERTPYATPVVVAAPPVLGAALLALDHVGAGRAAREALRSAFGSPVPVLGEEW
ncbi:ATPase [Nocardioides mangrovicus]|uniref:ATPase n=1 Tax=Nocardioides mangrovicus TaxID=2478913 RepID=A0A3L8P177_9ACTN|nr:BadF/BadG/BcrA/BcrD ATPase family protein [Nocardioides mangrovicus]RLV48148.1 ATPase [Nocardioides mangrovicus]